MEDSALTFFDNMYDTVPNSFKLVPKDYKEDLVPTPSAKKSRSSIKSKPMSMVELKERAQ